jgi:LPXTG-site transpeptidase (sortase) family protein
MLHRAIAAVAVGLGIWAVWGFTTAQSPPTASRSPDAAPAARRDVLVPVIRLHPRKRVKVDRRAAAPHRIWIPAIGVSAPVISLGLNRDGTMQTPRAWGSTGWYKPGPEPGERGAAVITGHVDSTTGPAVFYRLRAVRRGDVIRIRRSDRSVVRFRVQRVERWAKSEFPTRRVYGRTRGAVLRIVTCSGNFDRSTGHYVDNTIVYASRV